MEIAKSIEIPVRVTLKELADLEDKSLKLVDEKQKRIFFVENIVVDKGPIMRGQSTDKPIMATVTIVLNADTINVKTEIESSLKKLLKAR